MKIGIIREGKTPPDSRTPLTPLQAARLNEETGVSVFVQPSPVRCYPDSEYREAGLTLLEDLSGCDVLLGVKEVPIDNLIPDKTYFFFSHTIKEQAYNRRLLQAVLAKNIRLIDYEVLTDSRGERLIAFGVFAGMVGAHNALWTHGKRTGAFELPRMKDLFDYKAAKDIYAATSFPPLRIVLTGTGRVGQGAALVLRDMGFTQLEPETYLAETETSSPVFTQLECDDYARRIDGATFQKTDFYQNPHLYESTFEPYARCSDIMINGIYWDNRAPAFFPAAAMALPEFKIRVIADVTCDITPASSIPSTLFASTIAAPVFGYNPVSGKEEAPFQPHVIDMMTIDNLPNEMPRDASESFGHQFLTHIWHELLHESEVIRKATVANNGQLGHHFQYLTAYANQQVD